MVWIGVSWGRPDFGYLDNLIAFAGKILIFFLVMSELFLLF